MQEKLTTIVITSFNRLKYLRALVASLGNLPRENYDIIVIDNCSTENGLQDYVASLEKDGVVDKTFVRKPDERNWINDEYIAKNIAIDYAKTDTILFLQDDLQFIGDHSILSQTISDFRVMPFACLEMNGVRQVSIASKFASGRYFQVGSPHKYWISDDNHFHTMGLFKKAVFEKLGKYPVDWPLRKEFWGRSEDVYDKLVKTSFPNAQINASCHVPLFLPVWNDSRGGYAFIRGDRRYGEYHSAVDNSGLYYAQLSKSQHLSYQQQQYACSFPDVANPLGWDFTKTPTGDQVKYSQNKIVETEDGTEF